MNLIKGFKDKISIVSEDLSNSILSKSKKNSSNITVTVDLQSVGAAELLKNYQQVWSDMHLENFKISKLAEQTDKHLDQIFVSATNRYDTFCGLHSEVTGIDKLSTDIADTLHKIDNLKKSCIDLEDLLCVLENRIEEGLLRKSKYLKGQELQQYRRHSLQILETKKVQLAQNHAKRMIDVESKRQKNLLERQATFEEEFQRDLNQYRASGKFERVVSTPSSGTPPLTTQSSSTEPQPSVRNSVLSVSDELILATLQPDIDERTCAELDTFLQDCPSPVNDTEGEVPDSSSESAASPEVSVLDSAN